MTRLNWVAGEDVFDNGGQPLSQKQIERMQAAFDEPFHWVRNTLLPDWFPSFIHDDITLSNTQCNLIFSEPIDADLASKLNIFLKHYPSNWIKSGWQKILRVNGDYQIEGLKILWFNSTAYEAFCAYHKEKLRLIWKLDQIKYSEHN